MWRWTNFLFLKALSKLVRLIFESKFHLNYSHFYCARNCHEFDLRGAEFSAWLFLKIYFIVKTLVCAWVMVLSISWNIWVSSLRLSTQTCSNFLQKVMIIFSNFKVSESPQEGSKRTRYKTYQNSWIITCSSEIASMTVP